MAEAFASWLEARGGRLHSKLDLFKELPSGDRGVVATEDVKEGDLLLLLPITATLFIPKEDELSKRPDAFRPAVRYLRESHPSLSPFLATTLALMAEVAQGADSPFAAYVATLPDGCPDCLLNWTDAEKADLEGTALEQSGPDPVADAFSRHVAPVLAARPDLWPGLAEEGGSKEAGKGGKGGKGLQAFLRAAALVQSRAFHLEAENWVSGAKEITRLEAGGTQVFLLPGIDMINHSHNPARRNAHLQRLNVAQAAAAALVEGGAPEGVEAYFVMRADKPIAAGEEVLHTYGNLSDAQLLQTYGFVDSEDSFAAASTSAASGSGSGSGDAGEGGSRKKRAKTGKEAAAGKEAEAEGAGGYRNPYNAVLVPWEAVEQVCGSMLKSMGQAPPASLQRAKEEFLASAGVLQAAAPAATQFVLLAQEPLPDELFTAVQVVLMTKEEFNELKREHASSSAATGGKKEAPSKGASPAKGKGPAKGKSPAKGKGKGKGKGAEEEEAPADVEAGAGPSDGGEAAAPAPAPKLSLGTALLEEDEDFAEMTCIATLQVLSACVDRYPTAPKEDVRLLKSPDCTGRKRLAVRVRLGEKDVLQLAKKAVVELMKKLRDGTAGKKAEAGSEEGEEDEEASGSEEDEEEGSEESEEEEAPKKGKGKQAAKAKPAAAAKGKGGAAKGKAAGAGAKAPARKKQRRGLGAAKEGNAMEAEEEAMEEDGDDGLLMGSDDSEKVGYGGDVDFDDGIGEAHDRGKAHPAPKD
ncbi:hypothetical protein HYH03_003499 [Edaphochlamys debaryana]|uniref:SET domain-containing protein n=1 Tax=Edaphochlamys debaryana TaxID=47281 RepID=A0A836C3G3_9CHLO|nr:hypothetical protein HYH03_003499 [Edaphochlamys debaryana]|eukprot:KAG2498760.1 hypothetical protein HYH03_003499 [Edaphochlamys debaryana]